MAAANSSAICQTHAAYRPSTSPVPNFFADVRKTHQQRLLSQAVQNPRLRPLPPRGAVLSSMMIEGSKTGEERLMSAVEKREPAERKVSVTLPLEQKEKKETDNTKDLLRIRKLEADLRKLNDVLKGRNSEIVVLKNNVSSLEDLLKDQTNQTDESSKRLRTALQAVNSEREEVKSLQEKNSELEAAGTQLKLTLSSLESQGSIKHEQLSSQFQLLLSSKNTLEVEVRTLQHDKEKIKAEREENRQTISSLQNEVSHNKEKLSHANDRISGLEAKLTADSRAAKAELLEKETLVAEWQKRIEQCNEYIVRICQPQFSVVKDENLEPIAPGGGEPGGFVLVPLPLLLEGYGLLPSDVKKKIAEAYEASKQSSQPQPQAGNFAANSLKSKTLKASR